MSTTEYCYSTDQENYSGGETSRHWAAMVATEEVEGQIDEGSKSSIWTAECEPVDLLWLAGSLHEDVLQSLDDRAYELAGDGADAFTDNVSGEAAAALKTKLDALLLQWAREYGVDPKYWNVVNTVEHTVSRGVGDHGDTIYLDGEALEPVMSSAELAQASADLVERLKSGAPSG